MSVERPLKRSIPPFVIVEERGAWVSELVPPTTAGPLGAAVPETIRTGVLELEEFSVPCPEVGAITGETGVTGATGVIAETTGVTADTTGAITGATADTTGVIAETTGAIAETTGATADTTGVIADTTGVIAETTGVTADVTGATADVTGATADVTGATTGAAALSTLVVGTRSADVLPVDRVGDAALLEAKVVDVPPAVGVVADTEDKAVVAGGATVGEVVVVVAGGFVDFFVAGAVAATLLVVDACRCRRNGSDRGGCRLGGCCRSVRQQRRRCVSEATKRRGSDRGGRRHTLQ